MSDRSFDAVLFDLDGTLIDSAPDLGAAADKMRTDRGFFCFPEVDIKIPFTPDMNDVIQCKLSKATAHESMVTGRRYTAEQALKAGIVHEIAAEADVLPQAIAIAKSHAGKDPATLGAIKKTRYAKVLESLSQTNEMRA